MLSSLGGADVILVRVTQVEDEPGEVLTVDPGRQDGELRAVDLPLFAGDVFGCGPEEVRVFMDAADRAAWTGQPFRPP